ncbi:HAD-IC family P-type ATPase [Methylocystis sp. IM3]|uniref:HAD-IC family P-type ATPase n=1 Tax=unclassified Methylocystis TaxID=2625913 RepID=UPI0030F73677
MGRPDRDPAPTGGDYWSRARVHAFARLAATFGGIYICSLVWAPFLSTFTWALTLAILFAPAHKAIEERLKSPNLAAAASVLIVALIVVAPMFFVAERLVSEAAVNADYIQRQIASSDWRQIIERRPWAATLSHWIAEEIDLRAIVGQVASWLTNMGAAFVRKSTAELIGALITFYALFYLLRDGRVALLMMKRISPLAGSETNLIKTRVADTVYAIIYGTVVVSAVQGALGGLMFWWLNLPTPLLWGLVMGILSIVPILGAFVVWIPAAIVLALDGHWTKAIILASWGALVVGTVDNFLRPLLMSGRLKIHTFTTFISLVGGLNLFGAPGLILGPVAATVTIALLSLWRTRDETMETIDGVPPTPPARKLWHCASINEVFDQLGVSAMGLSTARALELLAAHGPNTLKETKPIRAWAIFFAQFGSILIWILIAAAVLSGFLGDEMDAIIILAIVFLNAFVGFYQEFSAEKSILALTRMTAPRAKVWRDGALTTIASAEVVPGDILELEAGDLVAADARLLNAASLACVESALTGESEAVAKSAETLDQTDLPIGDRKNMVFMGTSIATGSGQAVVVATAMQTEFGAIASLLGEAGEDAGTPIQQRLEVFGRVLLWATLAIVSLLFGLGVWRGGDALELFMTSVSLAVAAIPESLPAVVTAALSLGVMQMSRRGALVRRLASVETLGSTNVICTDKTGTLTVGQMTVRRLFVAGRTYEVTGEGYGPEGDIRFEGKAIDPGFGGLRLLGEILVGCNSASLERENDAWKVIGDPTEGALLSAGRKAGADRDSLEQEQPKIFEIPFDSDRKLHSVVRRLPEGRLRVLTNGAPELLLERCSHIFGESGVRQITASDREEIARRNAEFAGGALRVLGSAFRDFDAITLDPSGSPTVEGDLVFVGLSGLFDPPRPEAKDAIAKCRSAGVRVVVITGDHPHTATAIGRDLGLDAEGRVLSGVELDKLTDEGLAKEAPNTAIYARVSAEHKLRIIKAWQANKAVVAMTGDGVNDAPAIKGADIGVAMGRAGTEVTKQASDMVITDDNFATIVAAIEEGRGIYENIRKTLLYLLACNSGELLLMTICIIIGLPAPLLPIHLLWINLITDGPPALCLAADRVDASVMSKHPRERNKEIADEEFLWTMLLVAAPTAGVSFAAYAYGLYSADLEIARTYAFMAMIFAQLFTSLGVRSRTPIWRQSLFSNIALLIVIVVSISMQISIQQNHFLADLLKTAPIPFKDTVKLLTVALMPLLALETVKFLESLFDGERTDRLGFALDRDESDFDRTESTIFARKNGDVETTGRGLDLVRGSAIGVFAIMMVIGGWFYWSWRQAPGIQSAENEARGLVTRSLTAIGAVSTESASPVVAAAPGIIETLYCDVGVRVVAGQLCAKIDPQPYQAVVERARANLAAARAKFETDAAELTRAKSALERNQALAQRRAATRRTLVGYEGAYKRALAKAKRDEDLIAQLQSELNAAEIEREKTNIVSPVDGTVISRSTEIGMRVTAGSVDAPLFLIALANAELKAQFDENDASEIKIGDPVSVTVNHLPNRIFQGTVKSVLELSQTTLGNRPYNVVVSAPNPEALLVPGMKATVRIAINRQKDI